MTINCEKCLDKPPCGCCGFMIFEKKFVEKFKDKIEPNFKELAEKGNQVCYLYDDYRCPFLDRKIFKCKIYENRPNICKIFGTGIDPRILCPYYKPNGSLWSDAKRKQLERIRNKMVDNVLKK